MNNPHQGPRLTVYSREQIVARSVAGQKAAEVAEAFGVPSAPCASGWRDFARAGKRRSPTAQARPPARRDACRIAGWRLRCICDGNCA